MTGSLVQREALTASDRAAMFALLDAHFQGVSFEQFTRDLESKNFVVLVERDGRLVGFSTILVYEAEVAAELLTVIYSGDTIISPEAWGSPAFPRAWIHSIYELRRDHYRRGRLIWLLLTSGFRTYRLLSVFWREFYPHAGIPTPPQWQRILDTLARDQFGDGFDAAAGIVRLEHPQQLRGWLRDVPCGRERDAHVAFFLSCNPGHARGDELVCISHLGPDNLTPAGRRMV
ncbi:MAG TPA: hypothetical protein VIL86_06950 [Tepidisphaeraceae bacterium]|jgi:hypothetical protein